MFRVRLDKESEDYKESLPHVFSGFVLGLTGELILGFGGPVRLGLMLALVGTLALGVGLAYVARSKNRSVAWAGLALFSGLGWFFVAYLEPGPPSEDLGAVNASPNMAK